jgi:hypothetical protein
LAELTEEAGMPELAEPDRTFKHYPGRLPQWLQDEIVEAQAQAAVENKQPGTYDIVLQVDWSNPISGYRFVFRTPPQ